MKTIKVASVMILITISFVTMGCNNQKKTIAEVRSDSIPVNGFALLELFTSEGCSSCPPADKLLARIQNEAGNKPIYLLSEHVDYWDRQGWKDIFSQAQFSQRQYQYDGRLKSQVYTPQLIVNGQIQCIGSDENAVNAAIQKALGNKELVHFNLESKQEGLKMNLSYHISGNANGDNLLIAVIQKHAIIKVRGGENRGRTLNHAQIVRNLISFGLQDSQKGTEQINLPGEFNKRDWEIIGFLQDQKTGEVISATSAIAS